MHSNAKAAFRSGACGRLPGGTLLGAVAVAAAVSVLGVHGGGIAVASDGLLIRQIADGRAWQMRSGDGRASTLVLYADGTGKITGGVMKLSPKWRSTSDGMCLKPAALIKEQCVVLRPTSRGFIGTRDGATLFTLER